MKLDRMIGILAVLLQKEKVTAPWLAEKFEVSRRTINRDIERLCMAGIPIVTTRGADGGISIMEGYAIDRTMLTSSDMQAVLALSLIHICRFRCGNRPFSVRSGLRVFHSGLLRCLPNQNSLLH